MQEKTKQKKREREREKGRETDTSKWRPLTVRLRAPRYDCVLRNMTTFSFGIFSFFLSFFALFLEFRVHFLRSRFMQFASVPRAPSPTPSHALSLRVRVSCCIYEARTSFCGSPLCAGDFLGRPRPFFLELLVAFSFFF